jgi:hypothetical protein
MSARRPAGLQHPVTELEQAALAADQIPQRPLFKPERLQGKINIAERAISQRLCDESLGREERLALRDALIALRVLLPPTELQDEKKNVA